VSRRASTVLRTLPLAALLAGCATARPLSMIEFGARGPTEQRVLGGLKQLFTLQMSYRAQNGRFAATTDELKEVGWEDGQDFGGYHAQVTDHGSRLCVAMVSTPGARATASMDGEGTAYAGPRCGR